MSLYRQPGGRGIGALVATAAATLLVGGLIGFLVGRGSAGDPSLADQVADVRADLEPVALAYEQVPIEYEPAVRGGEIAARTEYQATLDTIERAQETLAAVGEDLLAVDGEGMRRLLAAQRALLDAVRQKLPLEVVTSRAEHAQAVVDAIVGR